MEHLRARDGDAQATTTIELFFDLVYVFAVTQVSHVLIHDLSWTAVGHAAFLLLVVWWAWMYTTWMVNWFEPGSPLVRLVLVLGMLASLLMAAALPEALGPRDGLFAVSYVALQVGRNVAAMLLLDRDHVLRAVFERITAWSLLSGALWLAGAFLVADDHRLWLWGAALAVDLVAPVAGYQVPGRGKAVTTDYDVEGGHFAERCQGFVIIALGESVVVTGATAADTGLRTEIVVALTIAFLGTAALWWLYFGAAAEHSRRQLAESDDPGRLARDAYTYLHLPIVAGVILAAVGDDLLIAHAGERLTCAQAAVVLGGPALYLLAETLFRLRMTGTVGPKRLVTIVVLVALIPLGVHMAALVLGALATGLLIALAIWESAPGVLRHSVPPAR